MMVKKKTSVYFIKSEIQTYQFQLLELLVEAL